MRIGCLGMATMDTLLFIGEPAYDHEAVTPVDATVISAGGKGIVCAIAMKWAGADVLPFSLLGTNSKLGETLPSELSRKYLLPLLDADSRTWITISATHKVITFVETGSLSAQEVAIDAVEEFVGQVDALYITIDHVMVLRAALRAASAHDVTVALNPSLPLLEMLRREDPALLGELVSKSNYILCNDWEAPRFLHGAGAADWSELDAPGLQDVVVTAGAEGGRFSVAPFESWDRFQATPASEVRCVVGAGDTFNGAYLTSRLLDRLTPRESCRKAADLAATKVAYRGSALPL